MCEHQFVRETEHVTFRKTDMSDKERARLERVRAQLTKNKGELSRTMQPS
jgi:hypothetical protein